MANAIFIDTTLCTGCRGCQVACKQWHDLPAEETTNRGGYQNPADFTFNTYKLVRMKEEVIDGRVRWLFFPDQCRHCLEPPCLELADDPGAIYQDDATGAVLYTAQTKGLDADEITVGCPYRVPRSGESGILAKCDFCNDRVRNGMLPSCVQTCPTGAMNFGSRDAMLQMANMRVKQVRGKYPKATLIDADDVSVIYLTAFDPNKYHEFAIAAADSHGMTRQLAVRRMFRPLTRMAKVLAG